jgi:hypothetical protein
MAGPPEQMEKERVVTSLISRIQNSEGRSQEQLIIQINDGEQVVLARFIVRTPSSVTKNLFR